jgi:DNA-binding response OmpR family regulator
MNGHKKDIIIATNNPKCRILFENSFSKSLFNLIFADSPEKVYEKINEHIYSEALLVESSFNKSEWKETVEKLKKSEQYHDLAIILFSHSHEINNDTDIYPADLFIQLPFSEKEFTNSIEIIKHKNKDMLKKILLVDDSIFIHKMVETSLSDEKFKMLHAYDGQEGIETAEKYSPDLYSQYPYYNSVFT